MLDELEALRVKALDLALADESSDEAKLLFLKAVKTLDGLRKSLDVVLKPKPLPVPAAATAAKPTEKKDPVLTKKTDW